MEEEFVLYDLALKLKELGFNEMCIATFDEDNNFELQDFQQSYDTFPKHIISAPLWQQAFDWFREKYELHSCILVLSKLKWAYVITNFTDYVDSDTQILKTFETYEEARESCLLKLIELFGKY